MKANYLILAMFFAVLLLLSGWAALCPELCAPVPSIFHQPVGVLLLMPMIIAGR